MKHEWRKHEKMFYLPPKKPTMVSVPSFKFFTIKGQGNPNDSFFGDYIGVLYSLAYAVKMSPKKDIAPKGYFDYTVYPLEGVWDISDKAKNENNSTLDKNELIFKLMIRQPNFVTDDFASLILKMTKKKKPHELLDKIQFETIKEDKCIQMLHLGPYDDEPKSFKQMEKFAKNEGVIRKSKRHREIYLSDARRVAPEKLKTVLRFKIEPPQ
jgi:hypothetical protein